MSNSSRMRMVGWNDNRMRFSPTALELANFVREKRADDPNWTLSGPVSENPPLHAAVACMAVMPRNGLQLVPYNLPDILKLPSCEEVNRMYDPDGTFVLEKLLEAVKRERPDLAASNSFFWRELKWHPQYYAFLRPRMEKVEGKDEVKEKKEIESSPLPGINSICGRSQASRCQSNHKPVSSSKCFL